MEIKISEVIKNKRRELNISQEALGNIFGVTVQAVSKWETGLSYPDITMLPKIAEYFNISLNSLFYGTADSGTNNGEIILGELPDDDKLRVIQCRGKKLLKSDKYSKTEQFKLLIPDTDKKVLNFEVWGSADIEGDISGNLDAGGGVNCGNVGGNADAGGGINCSNVGGNLDAGGGVNCGPVGCNVDAGGGVNCGAVGCSVEAGGDVKCGNISGDAKAGRNIDCKSIEGNASCSEKITINSNK